MINYDSVDEIREKLIGLGKYIMDEKMTWGTAGNISARADSGSMLITASGTEMGRLNGNDLTLCSMDGEVLGSGRKPSKELPMHLAVYKNRPEINVIIHASPFFSTMASCSDMKIMNDLYVESMYYLERVERVAYFHPGSLELADAVDKIAGKTNIILLENHGVLVYDVSFKEARIALEILENTCRMQLLAAGAGLSLNSLEPETVASFLNDSGYKPKRVWNDGKSV